MYFNSQFEFRILFTGYSQCIRIICYLCTCVSQRPSYKYLSSEFYIVQKRFFSNVKNFNVENCLYIFKSR